MGKRYSFSMETPQSSICFKFKTETDFVLRLKKEVMPIIDSGLNDEHGCIEDRLSQVSGEANKVLKLYRDREYKTGQRRVLSKIEKAGLAKDFICCILANVTQKETLGWLQKDKGLEASQSTVSRFWLRLKKHGIKPLALRR